MQNKTSKTSKNNVASSASPHDLSSMVQQGGRQFLLRLKRKSIRSNNAWFRVLSLDKRRFIDAVIQTVDRIQSSLLLKLMTELAEKLLCAIGGIPALIGNIRYGMINYGVPLAGKISALAQSWGNHSAKNWANDEAYVRYLTVIDLNNLPMYRASGKP